MTDYVYADCRLYYFRAAFRNRECGIQADTGSNIQKKFVLKQFYICFHVTDVSLLLIRKTGAAHGFYICKFINRQGE